MNVLNEDRRKDRKAKEERKKGLKLGEGIRRRRVHAE